MIDLYTSGAAHQTAGMRYLQKGIEAAGELTRLREINGNPHEQARACVLWGTRNMHLMGKYETVYILEAGYFRDRLSFYSLGIGGLNGRAHFNNEDSPSDRWIKHGVARQPWRHHGDYILIMGQVPGDMALENININQFYADMLYQIRNFTHMPVFFRSHPLAQQKAPEDIPILPARSLDEAFKDAAMVVTYNSNSGVDAALAGVPVYAHDIGSMAWPIAAHSIKRLFNFGYPDRRQWLYNLAYTQWTVDELTRGEAWEHICKRANVIELQSAAQRLNRSH